MLCPCCSGLTFQSCCEPLIKGDSQAQTPQALMRSRYTAYTQQNIDYIYETYALSAKAKLTKTGIADWANSVTFVRLEVLSASDSDTLTNDGYVEFAAYYLQGNVLDILQEKSRFVRESQQWRYIDGIITEQDSKTITRNDPCPCQSGKKFKKCHG